MTSRVLVTGATGFIGHHLVKALLERGDQVRCLVRPTSDTSRIPTTDIELVTGDVLDPSSLAEAVEGIDTVYHLAGQIDASMSKLLNSVNVEGTRNIAEACARQGNPPVLVIVSSQEAGGPDPNDRPRTEADPPAPVTHYGNSKLLGERAASEYASRVPITIMRTAGVFGEGDRATLSIFRAFRIGGLGIHPLPRAHKIRISLIHAADLSNALILAAERGERLPGPDEASPKQGVGLYYPTAEERQTFAEIVETASRALGHDRIWIIDIPLVFAWIVTGLSEFWSRVSGRPAGVLSLDKARAAAAGSWTCSPEKTMEQLGFAPEHSLAERVHQTVAWYREHGWL